MDYTVQITIHNKQSNNTFRDLVNRKIFLDCIKQDLRTMKNPKIELGKQYIKVECDYLYTIYTILNPKEGVIAIWQRDINVINHLIR